MCTEIVSKNFVWRIPGSLPAVRNATTRGRLDYRIFDSRTLKSITHTLFESLCGYRCENGLHWGVQIVAELFFSLMYLVD